MVKNRDRQPGVYSVHEAKTQLSRLLDQVLATGESVAIGRRGKAEVVLAPMGAKATPRRLAGLYRSTIKLSGALPPSVDAAQGPLLISAQTLVRWLVAPFELPAKTHALISDSTVQVAVSTEALRLVLVWANDGILQLGALKGRLAAACTSQGIEVLSVTPQVIERAAGLEGDVDAALAMLENLNRG